MSVDQQSPIFSLLLNKTQSLEDFVSHASSEVELKRLLLIFISTYTQLNPTDVPYLRTLSASLPPDSLLCYLSTVRIEDALVSNLSLKFSESRMFDFADFLPAEPLVMEHAAFNCVVDVEHDPVLKQLLHYTLAQKSNPSLSEATQLELVELLTKLVEARPREFSPVSESFPALITALPRSTLTDAVIFKFLGDSLGLLTRVDASDFPLSVRCSVLLRPDLEKDVPGEMLLTVNFSGALNRSHTVSELLESPVNLPAKFRFLRKVGQGAFGEVWHVQLRPQTEPQAVGFRRVFRQSREELRLRHSPLALKIISEDKPCDAEEAVYMRLCGSHPNILPLHSVFSGVQTLTDRASQEVEEHSLCFLMDLKDANFEEFWDSVAVNELSAQVALNTGLVILRDVASALSFMHADAPLKPHIVFRDLKPHNVLVKRSTVAPGDSRSDAVSVRACLSDFGLARLQNKRVVELTSEPGTLEFMAPEQLGKNYGRPVDVYAFGLLIGKVLQRVDASDAASDEMHRLQQRCVDKCPFRRPLMAAVKTELDAIIVRRALSSEATQLS